MQPVPLVSWLVGTFDAWAETFQKSLRYKTFYWWYLTQDKYFSTGVGKLFVFMQLTSLFGNVGLVLIVLDKIFVIPRSVYKYTFLIVALTALFCLFLGRFMDKSKSLHLENEWSNLRNPAMIELRRGMKKLK